MFQILKESQTNFYIMDFYALQIIVPDILRTVDPHN